MSRWSLLPAALVAIVASACSSGSHDASGLATEAPIGEGCIETNLDCHFPDDACQRQLACNESGGPTWSVASGASARDGRGRKLGLTAGGTIAIVYGQKKVLFGDGYVLAKDVVLDDGRTTVAWVPENAIAGGDPAALPTIDLPDPGTGYSERFWITGGDPSKYAGTKISDDGAPDTASATFLASAAGTVCLLHDTPGHGQGGAPADVVEINSGAQFYRAQNVPSVDVYTVDASGKKGPTMKFVYGHVVGKPSAADRFGWIASDALEAE